ncbi:MAG: molybdenum cofactor biosynthesis protein MoaE, partial [Verrucomicrobiae bacterium]|nr:molybdenum cofactor biosynthesis protein MoaE [Verrucomicrobiae bacterium]
MTRFLQLTTAPIDEARLLATAEASSAWGAVIRFSGVVRGVEAGAAIPGIRYEAFEAMAVHQFHKLFDEMSARWPEIGSVRLVHRLGDVAAGEASLWVEVAAPHRGEAFAACQWLIDGMKQVVPIWKRVERNRGAGI